MKIDIIGASNAALSLYKDFAGNFRRTTEVTLGKVLSNRLKCNVETYIAFTIARFSKKEKCYIDCCYELQGGDVLILQGEGNDAGMHIPVGTDGSLDGSTYNGAINTLIKEVQNKYEVIIFTTGFNSLGRDEYCDYNRAIKNAAEKHGCVLIDFFKDNMFAGPEVLPDQEHMSEYGLSLYADKVIEKIKELNILY